MVVPEREQLAVEWDSLVESVQEEVDSSRRDLKEIALMLDQSQLEVSRLAQRNASITSHLQHVQAQFDNLPRADIRLAYDGALDAQQRLFVMRGQLEKLQSDHLRLKHYTSVLERVLKALESSQPTEIYASNLGTRAESVEMIIQAQEAERQSLSRLMHDGPAQALSNFILQTEIALRLFDINPAKAKEELLNLKKSATTTFQRVRDFIFDLRPMMLDDLGLVPTMKRYIDAFRDQSGMDIRLVTAGSERRLESYLEVMIFRSIQEILKNAIEHSQATEIKIQLDMGETDVRVMIEDNGKGFDPAAPDDPRHKGLKLIRERVEMLGGYLEVDSVLGRGTRAAFQVSVSGRGR